MKPPTGRENLLANCACLAESLNITITDMAGGCQQSWSQKMPGPTGTVFGSQQAGWALFSTPGNCLNMSDSDNFYSDSPGQTTTTTTSAPATTSQSGGCDMFKLETCDFQT